MGNGNAGFLTAIEWSCLVMAIDSTELEGASTIIDLDELSHSIEVVSNISLPLVFICESHVEV
jgi:hypothetical protein